ncbi:helix-turn-helix protein [Mucilaginibacter frigoritolerans]|uniref:Helix-turn-helix protein n=1 Tax=Mucilaginibacter frigoritolerans TaxID=652788 RepID=A0A562UCC1_9SPHI|nr:helix-turn-helix transcriptional regulator [Mucilaginibacter frigoritolerans]TWJ03438.1 helix-turn-helix protein [Mucilaginibacter frigoritolerans]
MISLEEFYKQMAEIDVDLSSLLPGGLNKEIGHFNVFNMTVLMKHIREKPHMPYNRRAYYKINLIKGRNRAEYADKVIEIEKNALLFATPKLPYHWIPLDFEQAGHFCVFTDEFLNSHGIVIDDLPIFKPDSYPVFELTDSETEKLTEIFMKMHEEIASDYIYKYDLLRNYVLELIHFGQKLQPASAMSTTQNSSARVSSLFVELLERQFPIESPQQKLKLRTAKDYADRLAVHVNHLNKLLKEATGKTTTDLIAGRIVKEAKILLKQTDWNISEIAFSLGFDEVAHFSNFFKKQTQLAPLRFRS